MASVRTIGLMSGTSMDGVDVALIETDGETISAFGPIGYRPYTDAERALLRQGLADASAMADRSERPGVLADAERMITAAHVEAVENFLRKQHIARESIDVIGFHGQTVLHRPEQHLTVQIGDGASLAAALQIPAVYDLRAADVAAGGQGAPLVPVYHCALVRSLHLESPVCVVNIGGVSNISYVDGDTLIACDTGPGNALLDDFMLRTTGAAVDRDGALAASGQADEAWIATVLQRAFFALPPPKSLDRNDFASLVLPQLSAADGAATLTALTAAAIARIVPHLPRPPMNWIAAGGGANNPTLMRMLSQRLPLADVRTAASFGWQGDAIEAQAFGFLAVRSLKGLPLTFPQTTGVVAPQTGGVLAKP
ncbi:anhydro-N-acetylmuramic acid kinase [Bradyrhizobium sp. LHD-71]|uniref:anhydro-N-acetylmuramic acid kinase n=1 Tax=Bradyrhizobium sp. LHD-71 TaxID=3072141 RepID=UPI00280FBFD7|nr:anhydro-N-acetylmuramic acid kinase [Bradyrhizobium sp. LHD-71]MDQ8731567.1 anhydro-N-acetylmuramic acid kinase [Bradyrhizobium sp. LHD-71]